MDERVRSGPNQLVDQLYSEYVQMLDNNPVAQLRKYLTPKSFADAAGLLAKRTSSLMTAGIGNPQEPNPTGLDPEKYGIQEPMREHQQILEMRNRLVEKEQETAPRANNMGGFVSQMYNDNYNIGNAYGN